MLHWWRYGRASLIALVLCVSFVAGWPARIPKMVKGWPRGIAAVALRVPELQQKLLAPFAPVAGALGITTEDWRLFTGTGGTRYRMWVEGRGKSGSWKLFYRPHDPEHTYLKEALEYRRVLNVWNPHHDWISDAYPAYTRWLARRIFDDDAGIDTVRVRMEELTIESHGAGFTPSGRFAYEEVVRRDEVAP